MGAEGNTYEVASSDGDDDASEIDDADAANEPRSVAADASETAALPPTVAAEEKGKLEYVLVRLVVNRDPTHTNFVEFRNYKVVYRRYAGLFFSLCVDLNDNELTHLESIHLFVEMLDHFFANVCELDLVFNFQKVYLLVDEFILGGELQDTSKRAIMERLAELERVKD